MRRTLLLCGMLGLACSSDGAGPAGAGGDGGSQAGDGGRAAGGNSGNPGNGGAPGDGGRAAGGNSGNPGNGGAPGGGGNGGANSGSGGRTGGTGGSVVNVAPTCDAAGGDAEVATPQLIAELGDRWHEAWLASPVAADLEGDGTVEIIASRHGLVLGWHLDGTVVFRQEVEGRCWASPVVADIRPDIDGLEIAQASSDSIYAWQADGTPLPGFPYAWRGELRSLAAGDIDDDGELELVAVTTQNLEANGQRDILIAVNADGSVVDGFPPNTTGTSGCDDACYVYNGYDQNIAIGDVDGDGVADIFATQDNAYNSLHHGNGVAFDCASRFSGCTKFLGVRGLHAVAEAEQGWAADESTALQAHHTNTAPAIADIDGDDTGELVYVASVQNAAQDQRELGVALWALENDGTRVAGWETPLHFSDYLSGLWDYGENIVAITNQVTVADIDPQSAGPELIFAGFDGHLHAVGTAQNRVFDFEYTTRDDVMTGGVVVADLSADGSPEIVFATYSTAEGQSALFVLDAAGRALHELPLPGRGAMPVPSVDDADGDGSLDILVSLKDATQGEPQVLVYSVSGARDNCMLWPTGRGSYLRNGYVSP